MELNREQIIKAMECCYDNNLSCIDCPFQATDKYFECANLTNSALALIKELTEENEDLKAQCRYYAEAYHSVKADTVRKMQKRLNKHFCHDPAFLGVEQRLIMDVIDKIAKEMLEGGDQG